jgi:hypothetical protein
MPGKVIVAATIENLFDLYEVRGATRQPEDARQVEVEALVDASATFLLLPRRYVRQLGLQKLGTCQGRTCGAVRLTVQGRECTVEAAEVLDDSPAVIGLIPLTALDLVVDPSACRLIGNPDHGGEPMMDLF